MVLRLGDLVSLDHESFDWRAWDGDAVVYDALSGDMHRVANPGGRVLEIVRDASAITLGDLLSAMTRGRDGSVEAARVLETADALIALGILTLSRLEDSRPGPA